MNKIRYLWRWLVSIFIGSDATSKVLHMYSGSTNIEKSVTTGTSFHSSMPYLLVKSTHTFYYNGTTPYYGTGTYNSMNSAGYTTSTPLPNIDNYFCIVIGYIGTKVVYFPHSSGNGSSVYYNLPGSFFGNPSSNSPAFSITSTTTGYTGTITFRKDIMPLYTELIYDKIELIVLDDSKIGQSSDVVINSNDILINNTSIFSNTYLHFPTTAQDFTNTVDTTIAIPYGGQYFNIVGYGILKPNSVSYLNGTYTNNTSGGNYILVQLINSYNYPVSSIDVTKNSIGVVKNNVQVPLFNAASSFKSMCTIVQNTLIINNGYSVSHSGTYFLKSISLPLIEGGVIVSNIYTPQFTYQGIAQEASSCKIIHGTKFYIYCGGLYSHIYAYIDVVGGKLDFYYFVQDAILEQRASYRIFITDLYIKLIMFN